MRRFMSDAIYLGKLFQSEGRYILLISWPDEPLWSQRLSHTEQINHIPPGVSSLPLTGIRIQKISVERVAGKFIVKT